MEELRLLKVFIMSSNRNFHRKGPKKAIVGSLYRNNERLKYLASLHVLFSQEENSEIYLGTEWEYSTF